MKLFASLRKSSLVLASLGLLLPQPVGIYAGDISPATPVIQDVALGTGGTLRGQVVDRQGAGKSTVVVAVRSGDRVIDQVVTDRDGNFTARVPQGGVYQVSADGNTGLYRMWAVQTAPPAARPGVLMVSEEVTARGQFGGGFGWGALGLAGIAATIATVTVTNNGPSS